MPTASSIEILNHKIF